MPFGGPRFAPRGPAPMNNNPRFKQFPPQMQARMHYGPRQTMRPRQPNNHMNQNRPQNNQPAKPNPGSQPPNNAPTQSPKPANIGIKQEVKTPQEKPKGPLIDNKKVQMPPKMESVGKPTNAPSKIPPAPIKVVTSQTNVQQPKVPPQLQHTNTNMPPKPKQNGPPVNSNGNYGYQQKNNQYSSAPKDNQYQTQRDNQYQTQRDNQYQNQRDNQYSNANESRTDQGNWGRQGRQDYNKMGDKPKNLYFSNDRVRDRVRMIAGPQLDLPPLDMSEKKFNSYSRLFVGNLQKNTSQEDLEIVFSKYGEIGQTYVNKEASFAFINIDYKANALRAMKELDNSMIKGRAIKVRIAAISDGVRVKNLAPTISNELLEKAFSVFGTVESCKIIVDDRGSPTGDGVVIFKEKKTAFLAVKKCQDGCYILSGTARPVVVFPIEQSEVSEEGLPEASLQKNDDYMRERSVGPHFAEEGSFEFELGEEWKKVYQVQEERKKALDAEFQYDKERIEKKLVLARVEFEKEKLRKELAAREAESDHLRRHFASDPVPPSKTYAEGNDGRQYESYGAMKRPADTSYDTAYSGSYDTAYKEPYDMTYGRDYDRGYARDYDRANYNTYSREPAYERGYEGASADIPPLDLPNTKYDLPPADPQYELADAYSTYERQSGGSSQEAFKPTKRPRY